MFFSSFFWLIQKTWTTSLSHKGYPEFFTLSKEYLSLLQIKSPAAFFAAGTNLFRGTTLLYCHNDNLFCTVSRFPGDNRSLITVSAVCSYSIFRADTPKGYYIRFSVVLHQPATLWKKLSCTTCLHQCFSLFELILVLPLLFFFHNCLFIQNLFFIWKDFIHFLFFCRFCVRFCNAFRIRSVFRHIRR